MGVHRRTILGVKGNKREFVGSRSKRRVNESEGQETKKRLSKLCKLTVQKIAETGVRESPSRQLSNEVV